MEFRKEFIRGHSLGVASVFEYLEKVEGVNLKDNYLAWTKCDTYTNSKGDVVSKNPPEKVVMKARLICGKCNTEQTMTKKIICKGTSKECFCWWCPKCKDNICDSAVRKPEVKE